MRIDAHQHFWRIADRAGAWPPPELAQIYRDFAPSDLAPLLQECGIDGTVLVQSLPSIQDSLTLLELAHQHAFIRAVVGWVDLKSATAAHDIARLAADPKFRGVRPMLQDLDDDNWIDDPALTPAVVAMIEHGLCFDALVLPRHLPALLRFAQRFPQLPIVIDHAAKPAIARQEPTQELAPWNDDIARFGALPNVHCKLSGMLTEAAPGSQDAHLQPYVDHLLAVFGADRLIWGSDWPVLTLATDYRSWVDMSARLLTRLDANARANIWGLNACRFYRLS